MVLGERHRKEKHKSRLKGLKQILYLPEQREDCVVSELQAGEDGARIIKVHTKISQTNEEVSPQWERSGHDRYSEIRQSYISETSQLTNLSCQAGREAQTPGYSRKTPAPRAFFCQLELMFSKTLKSWDKVQQALRLSLKRRPLN